MLILQLEILLQHEIDQFVPTITNNNHIDLLSYNLILHFNILYKYQIMDIPIPVHSKQYKMKAGKENIPDDEEFKDVCFQLHQIISPKKSLKKKTKKYKIDYNRIFQIKKEGYMMKKTLNKDWDHRYFVLNENRLIYYLDQSKKQLKGCFNLASLVQYHVKIQSIYPEIKLFVEIDHEQHTHFKILMEMQIEDQQQFSAWRNLLSITLTNLYKLQESVLSYFPKLKKQNLLQNSKFGKNNNFWNRLTISTSELLKYATHLDIILLRSKNPFFYFHRFFMRSYYDHIAILIKDQHEKVYIFEAIQSKGVCISNLENLLTTFHDEYQEMGYRKFLFKGKEKINLEKLQTYLNGLIGKKYELSIAKLLLDNETQIDQKEEKQNFQDLSSFPQQKSEKTYFCSELIADIYLKFDILNSGKSNKYWPKDFQQNNLCFNDHFELSPLMIVQIQECQSSQKSQA